MMGRVDGFAVGLARLLPSFVEAGWLADWLTDEYDEEAGVSGAGGGGEDDNLKFEPVGEGRNLLHH